MAWRAEPIARVGVDETSFQRRHEYVTVVSDLERGRVVHVADGRGQEALEGYYRGLTEPQRLAIAAVAMDMWRPYIQATQAQLPGWATAVCFDRFHVAKHLGEAVNDVRKSEQRLLLAEGDERLKRTRFLWLMGPQRRAQLDAEQRGRFDALRGSTLKVARAWAIKEMARDLWSYAHRGWARRGWQRWRADPQGGTDAEGAPVGRDQCRRPGRHQRDLREPQRQDPAGQEERLRLP